MLRARSTAGLPDREIARRVGVSPSTVGSIRRRLAHPQGDLFSDHEQSSAKAGAHAMH